jgi:hypothetical protein
MGSEVSMSLTRMRMENKQVMEKNSAIATHSQGSLGYRTAYSLYPDWCRHLKQLAYGCALSVAEAEPLQSLLPIVTATRSTTGHAEIAGDPMVTHKSANVF